ncbi:MAG: hypothetical protein P8L85_16615 [Rubripirellula sp.]|nr:hypothetical protein [Rubripirellula sp.]
MRQSPTPQHQDAEVNEPDSLLTSCLSQKPMISSKTKLKTIDLGVCTT